MPRRCNTRAAPEANAAAQRRERMTPEQREAEALRNKERSRQRRAALAPAQLEVELQRERVRKLRQHVLSAAKWKAERRRRERERQAALEKEQQEPPAERQRQMQDVSEKEQQETHAERQRQMQDALDKEQQEASAERQRQMQEVPEKEQQETHAEQQRQMQDSFDEELQETAAEQKKQRFFAALKRAKEKRAAIQERRRLALLAAAERRAEAKREQERLGAFSEEHFEAEPEQPRLSALDRVKQKSEAQREQLRLAALDRTQRKAKGKWLRERRAARKLANQAAQKDQQLTGLNKVPRMLGWARQRLAIVNQVKQKMEAERERERLAALDWAKQDADAELERQRCAALDWVKQQTERQRTAALDLVKQEAESLNEEQLQAKRAILDRLKQKAKAEAERHHAALNEQREAEQERRRRAVLDRAKQKAKAEAERHHAAVNEQREAEQERRRLAVLDWQERRVEAKRGRQLRAALARAEALVQADRERLQRVGVQLEDIDPERAANPVAYEVRRARLDFASSAVQQCSDPQDVQCLHCGTLRRRSEDATLCCSNGQRAAQHVIRRLVTGQPSDTGMPSTAARKMPLVSKCVLCCDALKKPTGNIAVFEQKLSFTQRIAADLLTEVLGAGEAALEGSRWMCAHCYAQLELLDKYERDRRQLQMKAAAVASELVTLYERARPAGDAQWVEKDGRPGDAPDNGGGQWAVRDVEKKEVKEEKTNEEEEEEEEEDGVGDEPDDPPSRGLADDLENGNDLDTSDYVEVNVQNIASVRSLHGGSENGDGDEDEDDPDAVPGPGGAGVQTRSSARPQWKPSRVTKRELCDYLTQKSLSNQGRELRDFLVAHSQSCSQEDEERGPDQEQDPLSGMIPVTEETASDTSSVDLNDNGPAHDPLADAGEEEAGSEEDRKPPIVNVASLQSRLRTQLRSRLKAERGDEDDPPPPPLRQMKRRASRDLDSSAPPAKVSICVVAGGSAAKPNQRALLPKPVVVEISSGKSAEVERADSPVQTGTKAAPLGGSAPGAPAAPVVVPAAGAASAAVAAPTAIGTAGVASVSGVATVAATGQLPVLFQSVDGKLFMLPTSAAGGSVVTTGPPPPVTFLRLPDGRLVMQGSAAAKAPRPTTNILPAVTPPAMSSSTLKNLLLGGGKGGAGSAGAGASAGGKGAGGGASKGKSVAGRSAAAARSEKQLLPRPSNLPILESILQKRTGNEPCPLCSLIFGSPAEVDLHLRNHSMVCSNCDCLFASRVGLFEHRQTCQPPKRTPPPAPPSGARGRSGLCCVICPATAVDAAALNEHAVQAHNLLYRCPKCDCRTAELLQFEHHVRSAHAIEPPHPCNTCQTTFLRREELELHVRERHGPAPERHVIKDRTIDGVKLNMSGGEAPAGEKRKSPASTASAEPAPTLESLEKEERERREREEAEKDKEDAESAMIFVKEEEDFLLAEDV